MNHYIPSDHATDIEDGVFDFAFCFDAGRFCALSNKFFQLLVKVSKMQLSRILLLGEKKLCFGF